MRTVYSAVMAKRKVILKKSSHIPLKNLFIIRNYYFTIVNSTLMKHICSCELVIAKYYKYL